MSLPVKSQIPKSILIIFSMFMLLISCSQEEANDNDIDRIREQISEYKKLVVETNKKIVELEGELERLGGTAVLRNSIPVGVTTLSPQPFSHYVKVNANVEAVNAATISPETNGQIRSIPVRKGQKVSAGDVVARLNVAVIESSIREVETSLELAKALFERQKNLWDQQIGSEVQYLQAKNNYESLQSRLETLQSQLDMAIIRAPFDGIVDEIFSKEGELAMPGAPLMQIINLDQLYINADVSESFLAVLEPNDEVTLRFPAYPDFEQRTKIHRIGHVINPENRTFRLQLLISNSRDRFKPNMVASISFRSFSTDNALVVPSIIIKQDTQGHFVFAARKNGNGNYYARKVYIERGMDSEGRTMIRSGLNPNEKLITRGHNQVIEGTPLIIEKTDTSLVSR